MKFEIKNIIVDAIKKAFPDIKVLNFDVEYTNEKFGDYSTNVAMILGKQIGEKPQTVAQKIINNIEKSDLIESAEVAGPGFINFKIALPYLQKKISEIKEAGEKYGKSDLGKDLKVNVEFISANPTGPLTIGNSRGGVIGDVLSNVLEKTGWQVTREYYFNDKGGQIDVLGHSILKDDQAQYKGDYIDQLAQKIKGKDAREVGEKAAQIIISWIKKTTQEMGIEFDVWFAEGKDIRDKGKVEEVVKWLKEKDLAYEKEGALWFRSTKFGDDKDRVIIRSNGEPTYFGIDAAYHHNKFEERKFDKAIDIWGADHHGDVARIKGFVNTLGFSDKFDILLHQFVMIVVGGKEVRMSKRTGQYILVDDLLKVVGKDVYRFFMLEYAPGSHMTFDLKLAKEHSEKNPVYYVQYAYARIHSILAKSQISSLKPQTNNKNQISKLKDPAEISLIKQLIKLPDLVQEIGEDYQVQKLPFYAVELATKFHNFYEKCPVIKSGDAKLTAVRLELIKATQIVLKNTLNLMGISAPEQM